MSAGRKGGDTAIARYHLFPLDVSKTSVFHLSGAGWAAKGPPGRWREKGGLWVVGHRATCRRCVVETYVQNRRNPPNQCHPHKFHLKICYLEIRSNLRKVAPKKCSTHTGPALTAMSITHILQVSPVCFSDAFFQLESHRQGGASE